MKLSRVLLSIFILFSSIITFIPEAVEATGTKGYIDARAWDFIEQGLLPLKSDWEFYWNELLEPEDFLDDSKVAQTPTQYVTLPKDLTNIKKDDGSLPSNGYGTLRMIVEINDVSQVYALKSKYFSSAYKLWINGEELLEVGQVAKTKEQYKPTYLPMEAIFKTNQPTIEIIIQTSNFHHRRVRISMVEFGTVDQITTSTYKGIIKDSILFGSLLLISLYHLILFFLRRKEKAFIYFSLISLIVGLRVGIVNERMIVRLIPDLPAELMMKIGYLPVFLLLPLFILYAKEIFKAQELERPAKVSMYSIPILLFIISVTTVKVYDALFEYGQLFLFTLGGYLIFVMATKIIARRKSGSYALVIGFLFVLVAAIHDTLREFDIIQSTELLTVGILLFILIQAFYLAWRYHDSFNQVIKLAQENEAMYEEIQELNEDLEKKISLRTEELQFANNKLSMLSNHDPLTGIPNRRYFDDVLKQEWHRSIKFEQPLSLLMIDIDYFKGFNDFYGHLQGDECLIKVAEQLRNQLRKDRDFFARFGGEEFVVLLPNTKAEEAGIVADKLRAAIEQLNYPHELSEVADVVTVSIGITSQVGSTALTITEFINQADQALYVVKNTVRNSVHFF